MVSPFPGMDPFLEGDLWSDLHHELASKIRKQLTPLITPKYVARIEQYIIEDDAFNATTKGMYPDVSIVLNQQQNKVEESIIAYGNGKHQTPISYTIPAAFPIEVKIPIIEIKNATDNKVITTIEILSPVNKRNPGLIPYLEKRRKLRLAGIHLLEIDLIRRGKRPAQLAQFTNTDYLVALTRGHQDKTDIWAIDLKDILPTIPVPLASPDIDILIDLQQALTEIYQEAAYGVSIDYNATPPLPTLTTAQHQWLKSLIKNSD